MKRRKVVAAPLTLPSPPSGGRGLPPGPRFARAEDRLRLGSAGRPRLSRSWVRGAARSNRVTLYLIARQVFEQRVAEACEMAVDDGPDGGDEGRPLRLGQPDQLVLRRRSEEHTSELQ